MFGGPEPLWQQWERACDFLDEDLASGYVRVLQEMIAAGWSDAEVAAAVRAMIQSGWYTPAGRGRRARGALGSAGSGRSRRPRSAALMGMPFIGAESLILLGISEDVVPARSALRKIGR